MSVVLGTQPPERKCDICGHQGTDVKGGIIRLARPDEDGRSFHYADRCRDRVACRERREALGKNWPLADPKREVAQPT